MTPGNGIAYRAAVEGATWLRDAGVAHHFGTHAQPWFLATALKGSAHFTHDLDAADVVYIYDYCHYLAWLAFIHSGGNLRFPDAPDPGENLMRLYRALIAHPRWQRSSGRDFALYDPHPGFVQGPQAGPAIAIRCQELGSAITLLVDKVQRYLCGEMGPQRFGKWWDVAPRLIFTPYVPNSLSPHAHEHPWARPPPPRAARDTLMYGKETCTSFEVLANGITKGAKKMRMDVVFALQSPNVTCVGMPDAPYLDFKQLLADMARSLFCLVLPGDSPSTRRLGEVFMAGCIPVFVGPPYNAMPFAEDIDYRASSVFLNITSEHQRWLYPRQVVWDLRPPQQPTPNQRFWTPDAPIADVAIQITTAADISGALAAIHEAEVAAKLAAVTLQRAAFHWKHVLGKPPGAADLALGRICALRRGDAGLLGPPRGRGLESHAHPAR